jgi:diguanylate cyclase (GGDEF)-like protein
MVWELDPRTGAIVLDGAIPSTAQDAELTLKRLALLRHPDDRERVGSSLARAIEGDATNWREEYRLQREAAQHSVVVDRARIVRDERGRAVRVVGTVQDMSERVRFERELERLATHDPVTGLPNRTLLRDRLERAVALATRQSSQFALLYMDLDRFKEVNDSLGHHAGDELLREFSVRLASAVRTSDTVARLGGDEFAVLLHGADEATARRIVEEKLLPHLARPFSVDAQRLSVDASIGLVVFPQHGADLDALMRHADVAMYVAKRAGTKWHVYRAEEDPYSRERLLLAAELRGAIDEGSLLLHYQPKVQLETGHVLGVEALVRWRHPQRGMLPPMEFIPLAEETGLIAPLTLWVVREALRQCREWVRMGFEIPIAVNLSMQNLRDPALPKVIERLIAEAQVRSNLLRIEITESNVMTEPATTIATLDELRSQKIGISIDDFGTGYSSLAYLSRLPVDEVKIDRSFVKTMATRESDAQIVRVTVELGHALGMRAVAEGVEDQDVSDQLRELGCDIAQGFLVSKPLPANEIETWLGRERWHLPASDGACCVEAVAF